MKPHGAHQEVNLELYIIFQSLRTATYLLNQYETAINISCFTPIQPGRIKLNTALVMAKIHPFHVPCGNIVRRERV